MSRCCHAIVSPRDFSRCYFKKPSHTCQTRPAQEIYVSGSHAYAAAAFFEKSASIRPHDSRVSRRLFENLNTQLQRVVDIVYSLCRIVSSFVLSISVWIISKYIYMYRVHSISTREACALSLCENFAQGFCSVRDESCIGSYVGSRKQFDSSGFHGGCNQLSRRLYISSRLEKILIQEISECARWTTRIRDIKLSSARIYRYTADVLNQGLCSGEHERASVRYRSRSQRRYG